MNAVSASTLLPGPSADRRRWATLAVVCLAQLMIVLDVTIVNVALPSIQQDLHFSQGDLTWVVNAFLVTFGSPLLLTGRLGDLVGRKRVFHAGLVTFTVALAEVEVLLDRGQGNVHDRDVEHDHQLRQADHGQRGPAAPMA